MTKESALKFLKLFVSPFTIKNWERIMETVEIIEEQGFRFMIVKNNFCIEQFDEETQEYKEILFNLGDNPKSKKKMVIFAIKEFYKWYKEN